MSRLARAALLAALLLPLAAAQSAQDRPSCGGYEEAVAWWQGQEARVDRLAAAPGRAVPELATLHDDHLRELQLATRAEDRQEACLYLHAVARALEVADDPREAARLLRAAAAEAVDAQRLDHRPSLLRAATVVGAELKAVVEETPSTTRRIELLGELSALYREVGAAGPLAGAELWRRAEGVAWEADKARVAEDVARADLLLRLVREPLGNALYAAAIPDAIGRLEAGRDILASHGDAPEEQAQTRQVEDALERLKVAQAGATRLLLTTAGAMVGGAALVVLVARRPLRALASDVHELRVALQGVPR